MTSAEYLDAISPPKVQVTAAGKSAAPRKTEPRPPEPTREDAELIGHPVAHHRDLTMSDNEE